MPWISISKIIFIVSYLNFGRNILEKKFDSNCRKKYFMIKKYANSLSQNKKKKDCGNCIIALHRKNIIILKLFEMIIRKIVEILIDENGPVCFKVMTLLAYNFITNSSFQRLRDSCQLVILSNVTSRTGMWEKICLNIKNHNNLIVLIGVLMPLKKDINQISHIHLKLNLKSEYTILSCQKFDFLLSALSLI